MRAIHFRLPILALWLSCRAIADPGIPPDFGQSLPDLLQWAENRSPMLRAMQLETEAKRQQVIMARSLEDPMFSVEWQGIDRDKPSLSPSKVSTLKYTISQALPLWGKRDLQASAAEAGAEQTEQTLASSRSELRYQVRLAFADWYKAIATQTINREQAHLLKLMQEGVNLRYQLGQAPQANAIRLQTEISMLENERIALEGGEKRAAAALAALIDVSPESFRSKPSALPLQHENKPLKEWLDEAARTNPELLGTQKQIAAAQAQRDLAGLNNRPGLNIGLSAMQMDSRIENYELMLEIQLPFRQAAKQAERAEAAAMLQRAHAQEQAQSRMVERDLHQMWAMQTTAQRQLDLLDNTLLPQARLTFESSLSAYQTGRGEFAALLEAQQQIRRLRQMRLMAETERFQAWSGLQKMTGDR